MAQTAGRRAGRRGGTGGRRSMEPALTLAVLLLPRAGRLLASRTAGNPPPPPPAPAPAVVPVDAGRRRRRIPALRRREERYRPPRFRLAVGPILILATVVVAGVGLLVSSRLAGARSDLLIAGLDLQASRHALSQRDDAGAGDSLDSAAAHLRSARTKVRSAPLSLMGAVPVVGSPVRGARDAANGGLAAVAAGRALVAASSSFPTSASAAVDGHDLSAFHAAATRSQDAVAEADRHLATARAALAGPAGAALSMVSRPAKTMRAEIDDGRRELAGAGRGLSLLADLTGPNAEVRLLFLAQDSLELRPTGGYIGSYGVLHFSRGTVKLETFAATEDLPPADPPAVPPYELGRYLPKGWGLSNSNWWPDFPTSAAAAGELFRRQGGGQVDGVLALTEYATARLVGALGPLKLPSYAKPVTEVGFDRRVVEEVELKRPLDNPRKKFLIELSQVLFDRLFNLPADKLPAVANAVRASVGPGDVQLWFADPARQSQLTGTVIAGALPRTDGDFLMVVDSNMAASKANLDLTKRIDYQVERDAEGRLVGHVRVELSNDGAATPINPVYLSRLRVYAPAGARLLAPGERQYAQSAVDGPYEVFDQEVPVAPKSKVVATFDYLLPDRLAAGDAYHLTWVRQVGTPSDQLKAVIGGRSTLFEAKSRSLVLEDQLSR